MVDSRLQANGLHGTEDAGGPPIGLFLIASKRVGRSTPRQLEVNLFEHLIA